MKQEELYDTLLELIYPVLNSASDFIHAEDLEKLNLTLLSILDKASRYEEGAIIWPNILITDETGRIIFTGSNPDNEWPYKVKDSFKKYLLSLLGYEFKGRDDGFYLELINIAKNTDGNVLWYCERIEEENIKENSNEFGGRYAIYEIGLDGLSIRIKHKAKFVRIISQRFAGPFIDTDINTRFSNFIVSSNYWKGTEDLPPFISISTGFVSKEIGNLIKNLNANQNDGKYISILLIYIWLIQFIVFIFQHYYLSKASSSEVVSMLEEFQINGWISLIQEELDNKEIINGESERLLGDSFSRLLQIENDFVKKRVINKINILNNKEISPSNHEKICRNLNGLLTIEVGNYINKSNVQEKSLSMLLTNIKMIFSLKDNSQSLAIYPKILKLYELILDNKWINEEDSDFINEIFLKSLSIHENILDLVDTTVELTYKFIQITKQFIKLGIINEISEMRYLTTLMLLFDKYRKKDSKQKIKDEVVYSIESLNKKNKLSKVFSQMEIIYTLQEDTLKEICQICGKELFNIINRETTKPSPNQTEEISTINESDIKVTSLVSAKSGTGKTILSLFQAFAGASLFPEKKICIVDLDFYGPSLNGIIKGYSFLFPFNNDDVLNINEFSWIMRIQEIIQSGKDIELKLKNLYIKFFSNIFEGEYLFKRYKDYAGKSLEEIIDKLTIEVDQSKRIYAILSSPNTALQKLMVPLTSQGLHLLSIDLELLIQQLEKSGFGMIIFDCPAEIKEITECAVEITSKRNGTNIIVTTLYSLAMMPSLFLLNRNYFRNANKMLVFNKVRPLEEKYLEDKTAFLDYIIYKVTNGESREELSEYALNKLLSIHENNLKFLPWNDDVYLLFNHPKKKMLNERLEKFELIIKKTKDILEKTWGNNVAN